jgi:hypothetical protein
LAIIECGNEKFVYKAQKLINDREVGVIILLKKASHECGKFSGAGEIRKNLPRI